jgi:hypothetical protein
MGKGYFAIDFEKRVQWVILRNQQKKSIAQMSSTGTRNVPKSILKKLCLASSINRFSSFFFNNLLFSLSKDSQGQI